MRKKTRIKKHYIKFLSKTVIAFALLLIISFACDATAKSEKSQPQETTSTVNQTVDTKILREKVEQFLSLDESNPATLNSHIYFNISTDILPYDALLDLTERVVLRGINVNTIENLGKSYPDMSKSAIEHQQKLEYGRLYSQYAWILLKKNQLESAHETIQKAVGYISFMTGEDYLRLGIIEYENGEKEPGWNHITKALISDTIVEEKNPDYRKVLDKIIKDKFGKDKDFAAFIDDYRKQNARMIPKIDLITLENSKINTHLYKGRVVFVNFFSPTCGSCRQEIPSLKNLYKKFSRKEDMVFLFILNRPELKQEAIEIFEDSGIDKPVIAVLENGSVWDFIPAEPSIWITDKKARIIVNHSGYKQGDELIYEKKLSSLILD